MVLSDFVSFLDSHNMIDASKIKHDDDEGFENRLKLQKYTFLAKSFGLDLGYVYSAHLYGPYSKRLSKDYYELDVANSASEHPPFGLDSDGFLRVFQGRDANWLEIASTIIHEEKYDGGISRERAYVIKCDHSPAFIDSVYEDLAVLALN